MYDNGREQFVQAHYTLEIRIGFAGGCGGERFILALF